MQKFIVGTIGFLFWLVAIGLTIDLVYETTQGQSYVVMGVAGLAIGLSGFGLLLARHAWQRRAYPEVFAGIAMWVAGVVCLGFVEISFWVSSYESRYETYTQERAAKQRQESLHERDWKALTTGQVPVSVAQLEAMIEAKKLEPAVSRSSLCAAVTRLDSREPCREYFGLLSELAAARQREKLESEIKVEKAAATHSVSSDVFAGAEILAKWRGGDVKDWSYLIIIWSWALVTLVRDGMLLVMNPLGRARKPHEARKPETILPSEKVGQRQPRAILTPREDVLAIMAAVKPEEHSSVLPAKAEEFTPPTDGGTKAPEPVVAEDATTEDNSSEIPNSSPVVVNTDGSPYTPPKPSKRETKAEMHARIVDRFFDENYDDDEMTVTINGFRTAGGTKASQVRDDYETWCRQTKNPILMGSWFGRYVGARFNIAPGTKGKGKYYACVKKSAIPQKRKVAA